MTKRKPQNPKTPKPQNPIQFRTIDEYLIKIEFYLSSFSPSSPSSIIFLRTLFICLVSKSVSLAAMDSSRLCFLENSDATFDGSSPSYSTILSVLSKINYGNHLTYLRLNLHLQKAVALYPTLHWSVY